MDMLEKTITEELKREFRRRMQEETLPRIIQCLELLSEEQIWYRSNANTNAVGNLVLHLCGNISQYILTGIGGAEDMRERDTEFAAMSSHDRERLSNMITDVIGAAVDVVEEVRPDMLTRVRPVQCFQESILSMIVHVIEHSSYHTGQIALQTKLLLDRDLGFYAGLELNERS